MPASVEIATAETASRRPPPVVLAIGCPRRLGAVQAPNHPDRDGCRRRDWLSHARTGAPVSAFSTPDLRRGGPNPYSTLVPARNPAAPRSATKRSVIVGQKP